MEHAESVKPDADLHDLMWDCESQHIAQLIPVSRRSGRDVIQVRCKQDWRNNRSGESFLHDREIHDAQEPKHLSTVDYYGALKLPSSENGLRDRSCCRIKK
jgi:hypothetical protein